MTLRDLRNLPEPVIRRLVDNDALDDYGVTARGRIVEAGWDHRDRLPQQRLEVRSDGDGDNQPILDGYATIYDSAYSVYGGKTSAFGWDETIVAGAADKSLSERDDVYLLFDHDGLPLASQKDATLDLTSDKIGLLTIARPDMRSAWNTEVVMRVQSHALDAMSFAFSVIRQEWNDDYTERFITELRVWDVSIVKWPANPATHIHARATEPQSRGASLALALAEAETLRLARRNVT
jgi:hypothetical protein